MGAIETNGAPAGDIVRLTEHLFREEAGKLVSVLTGVFGIDRLQLAEDVVQEALVRALKTWPYYGIPKNPAAWITQTAKNLALDVIRREKSFHSKEPEIIATVEQWSSDDGTTPQFENEIQDNRLRLMFACCHPQIPQEAQIALALKTLCGLSPEEIARAFLTSEAAIAKRLTRARQRIQEQKIPFEIPSGPEISARLDGVLQTLYLLFNEGYKASSGESLTREQLCDEAIRLVTLLAAHPAGNQPRTHALAALMCLNRARLAARVDDDGNMLRLRDQDRARWDWTMIQQGLMHLSRSAEGEEISEYHLQAGIAACHGTATSYESTNWAQILALYDRLVAIDDSPVVALNRAVAVAQVNGPQAGIDAVKAIEDQSALESYYLWYSVLAEFEAQLGHAEKAQAHYRKAIELTELESERVFLAKRLEQCLRAVRHAFAT